MDATGSLRPALRAPTWHTLIGLLAVTGLRVGEACRLDTPTRTTSTSTTGLVVC